MEFIESSRYIIYGYCSEDCLPEDYIYERTCSLCSDADLKSDPLIKCTSCDEPMCHECFNKEGFLEEIQIRYGRYNEYCSKECCPDNVYDKITGKGQRKYQLTIELEKAGLELRDDSRLCSNYIVNNEGNLTYIVERMCQMKFLFDHNEFYEYMDKAKDDHQATIDEGYFPDTCVIDDAEYQFMEGKEYPLMWDFPWQKNNSIEQLFEERAKIKPEFLAFQYNLNRCMRILQKHIKKKIYHPDNQFVYNIHKINMEMLDSKQK